MKRWCTSPCIHSPTPVLYLWSVRAHTQHYSRLGEFCVLSERPGHDVKLHPQSTPSDVQGMTLNCIHNFIVTGSFLYWCVMRLASQRFFIHSCIYLRILIISYSATFLGTNSLSVLMCRKTVNQSKLWTSAQKSQSRLSVIVLAKLGQTSRW